MINIWSIYIICLLKCLTLVESIGFKGQIINVPNEIEDIYPEKGALVLNGNNYQSRFDIDLIKIADTTEKLHVTRAVLNKAFEFTFNDLCEGDYLLTINSYDFILEQTRYRVIVGDDIKVYLDNLRDDRYNASTESTVGFESPLLISVNDVKQFYEHSTSSLTDMIMSSPFGFIFKSKAYTIFFIISLFVIAAPYLINWINPEFSKLLEEVENEAKNKNEKETIKNEVGYNANDAISTSNIKNSKLSNPGIRKRH